MLKKIFGILGFIGLVTINGLWAKDIKVLDSKQENLVMISAYTANGDLEKLKTALNSGLDAGLSVNEIKEAIVHLYAYTGFPKSLNSLNLFIKVVEDRKAAGKNDTIGKEATPLPKDFDRNAYGKEVRAKLAGLKEDISGAPFQVFSPQMDEYLIEHLFADIFARDVIDHKTRELVTVSALVAMDGTAGQLVFHFGGALNMGITQEQLQDFIKVIDKEVGSKNAQIAKEVLDKVLKSRK